MSEHRLISKPRSWVKIKLQNNVIYKSTKNKQTNNQSTGENYIMM